LVAPIQRNFSGGELAPGLYARTDLAKYQTGLRTCRNMIVQKHGGVRLRPGTPFVGEVKDSSKTVRLLKFVFNDAQTYVMEFGDRYLRWFQSGGRIATTGVAAWITTTGYTEGDLVTQGGVTYYARSTHTSGASTQPGTGADWQTVWASQIGTIYEIPTPYATADLAALQIVQSADVVTITHPSYAPRELKRFGHTRWTLSVIVHGPAVAVPSNVVLGGGSTGTARWYAVTAIREGSFEESLPTVVTGANRVPTEAAPTTITWDSVPGAISYNVYRSIDGQTYGLITSSGGNPVEVTDDSWTITSEQAIANENQTVAGAGECRNPLTLSATTKAYDGKYTIRGLTRVLTAFAAGAGGTTDTFGRVRIYYSRDGEARVLADDVVLDVLPASGLADGSSTGGNDTELLITVPDNGYAALTIDLVPVVVTGNNVGGGWNYTIDTSAVAALVAWSAGATQFSDDGTVAADLSIAPPTQANLFAAAGDYPAAVGHYQQRAIYGGSTNEPEKLYASRTGSFQSFTRSTPLQDDDAVAFTLVGKKVNAVRHVLDIGRLVVFTSAEEKIVRGDQAGILRPDAINPEKLSAHGIATVPPLEVGDSAVYVQARGNIVRDLSPIQTDSYTGTDLTVFAAHLFKGKTIVDWDYAESPMSVIWCALSDGTLAALTYLREHGVWGWHRHDTDGAVENVCVVPEGDEDRVYFVVRRTINGVTKRYVERMAAYAIQDATRFSDVIFMDSALTYDGWNGSATTITLSGGTNWDEQEQLTATASGATFSAGDVGNGLILVTLDENGVETDRLRAAIEGYTSPSVVTVRADRTVPTTFRSATIHWARAVDTVSGLEHLEGERVSVLADGYVVASPNHIIDREYVYADLVVTGGAITLDRPYALIHVGLPFVGDIETLDLDTAGNRTIKDQKTNVVRALMTVEETRGVFVGPSWGPSDDAPLASMQEAKLRDEEAEYGPVDLLTGDLDVPIESTWDSNGRFLVRQVDPLPLTLLSIAPVMAP
jgi:hypothetical protein